MSQAELTQAIIECNGDAARIQALLATVRLTKGGGNLKVTAKGGFSVYGLGKFPYTFYLSQWTALMERVEEITAFIDANREKLAVKPAKGAETVKVM